MLIVCSLSRTWTRQWELFCLPELPEDIHLSESVLVHCATPLAPAHHNQARSFFSRCLLIQSRRPAVGSVQNPQHQQSFHSRWICNQPTNIIALKCKLLNVMQWRGFGVHIGLEHRMPKLFICSADQAQCPPSLHLCHHGPNSTCEA